jgi:integrase/recombinase XerD
VSDLADMRRAVDDYLRTRRALGFKLVRDAHFLDEFIAYLEAANADAITTDAALAWATLPAGADPSWWGTRLSVVRSFARWLAAFEPDTQVPPADLLPVRSQRAEPYPYTDADIVALMRAARGIPTPLCAATHETLIGLLAVTGMRIGEVIGLDRSDVDWVEGLVVVRKAKFDKSRELVLHPSTIDALGLYTALRDRHHPQPTTPAFFVSVPERG